MKKILSLSLLLLCLILVGYYFYNQFAKPIKADSKQLIEELKGYWVEDKFIIALENTKTFMDAVDVWVGHKKNIIVNELNYGVMAVFSDNKNNLTFVLDDLFGGGLYGEIADLVQLNKNRFEISFVKNSGSIDELKCFLTFNKPENPTEVICECNGKTMKYKKVGTDFESYINKVTLVGSYIDSLGRNYIFNENQTAIWPDKTFKYNIGMDAVIWSESDYFYVKYKDTIIYYCYDWQNDKLNIYNGLKDIDGISKKELFLVLSKK